MNYVIITGAYGGMGRSTALLLAKNGYTVFALDKKVSAAEENIYPIEVDVTSAESVRLAFEQVQNVTKEVAAIIHFAGVYMLDSLIEMDEEQFERYSKSTYSARFISTKRLCRS